MADTGCQDKTVSICRSYGLSVVKVSALPDRSRARNELIKGSQTDWQFYIEPWEILIAGHERIAELVKTTKASYHCEVLQGDTITKSIRLWRRGTTRFINPVFETLRDETSEYADVMLYLEKKDDVDLAKVEKWKQAMPLATDPYYFMAYAYLAQKKYKEFLSQAEQYLFHERNQGISATMTRYYVGIVHCLITNDLEAAIRNALLCIAAQPLMAEFWCLLGDVFFQAKEFEKSMTFYENAMLLGQRRLRADRWPMHISKYDEYPKEMMAACQKIVTNASQFYVKKEHPTH